MSDKNKTLLIVLAIIIGLAINGFFIGRALQRFKKEDRFISVKGFSEREVKSNFAVWTIKTRITSNDLLEGSKEIENNKNKIIEFLLNNGIKKNEIIQQDLRVTDKLIREYESAEPIKYRFIMENSIQVRSHNVDTIQFVSRMTDKLLKMGVVISSNNEYQPTVQYLYTELNQIKPLMLADATQNAKKAAQEFAKESNVRLGDLKKANQGIFSIIDRDAFNITQSNEGAYYPSSVDDIYKKIKVVVNIEYSIE